MYVMKFYPLLAKLNLKRIIQHNIFINNKRKLNRPFIRYECEGESLNVNSLDFYFMELSPIQAP